MRARPLSLRARLLLIVLCGGILPLTIVGVWLAQSISRSAEELLAARLEESLRRVAQDIGATWVIRRADLLTIAEHQAVQTALASGTHLTEDRDDTLEAVSARLRDVVVSVTLRTADNRELPVMEPENANLRPDHETITTSFAVFERSSGRTLGALDARLRISSVVRTDAVWAVGAGALLGAFDPASGAPLLPLPFEPHLLTGDRFNWAGDQWIAVRKRLHDPPLEIVGAVPILPFARPFAAATRQGIIALAVVVMLATSLTVLVTRETTQSLRQLAEAASAVSRGEYGRLVHVRGSHDEIGQVAQAFNTMTASLRQTVDESAKRQSLAAVGEFAASLAHEVRNPLSAIRIDLQSLPEKVTDVPRLRDPIVRALRTVVRLDATVTGALRVARSGQSSVATIDLRESVKSALCEAALELTARGSTVHEELGAEPQCVIGDPSALHQLFLNLLLNAAQSQPQGGVIRVSLRRADNEIEVRIQDSGAGIPPQLREEVFASFYSTKSEGTGLGLAIARRIATAHRGTLVVDETSGPGATFALRLPVPT